MKEYYDSSALLSKKDSRGLDPEIFIAVTNRVGGKTYNFSRLFLRRYLQDHKPRALLIRWGQDLKSRAISFGDDVMEKDPRMEGHTLSTQSMGKIAYKVLMDGDKDRPVLYVLALHDSEKIRENSSLFQQIQEVFFDEFQPESEKYVDREIMRFQSIHASIARGGKSHVRRVPVYMASNAASKINPYFVLFGIHKKPIGNQEFVNGPGWVLQQKRIDIAAREMEESGFGAATAGSSYQNFAANNEYLLNDSRFIKKMPIKGREIAVLEADAAEYGLWALDGGIFYISTKYDPSCRQHIAITRRAQSPGSVAGVLLASQLKKAYDQSCVFFADPDCYSAFMSMYDMDFFQ